MNEEKVCWGGAGGDVLSTLLGDTGREILTLMWPLQYATVDALLAKEVKAHHSFNKYFVSTYCMPGTFWVPQSMKGTEWTPSFVKHLTF
jgi:hypothetical protein